MRALSVREVEAEKRDPHEDVPGKLLGPPQRRVEAIAQDYLQQRDAHHREDECYQARGGPLLKQPARAGYYPECSEHEMYRL